MASIIKRKDKYSVVYRYTDDAGRDRQKWETFTSHGAAKKRKAQIEHEQQSGIFVVPTATTVADLLGEYTEVYGTNKWSLSTYNANVGLMENYILPLIGDIKLDDITPRLMDKFYQSLLKVKARIVNNRKPKHEVLTPHTVRRVHKLLRSAFSQAVRWEIMARNPVLNATLPSTESEKRDIWTVETLNRALAVCDNEMLALAIHLSFSCSLRMGEMLAITWDCVEISEESIRNNRAYIYINKELQRVSREVLKVLNNKDVLMVFPRTSPKCTSQLVLKLPKTKTSIRKIFLPKTVAEMLIRRKEEINELIEIYGDEYTNYNLVFTLSSGRPVEGQVINRELKKLIKEYDFPDIVFHSFRHASITYKLKWNGGDMKSVQGDAGHAKMDMIADVYSHIIDEDRRFNAQRFEEQFYSGLGVRTEETDDEMREEDIYEAIDAEEALEPLDLDLTEAEIEDIPFKELESDGKEAIIRIDNEVEAIAVPVAPIRKEETQAIATAPEENKTISDLELITKLISNPETASLLKALAKNL